MYSYEDRIRAVKLYLKLEKHTGPVGQYPIDVNNSLDRYRTSNWQPDVGHSQMSASDWETTFGFPNWSLQTGH